MYSEKATKFYEISTIGQIYGGNFAKICSLLRKYEHWQDILLSMVHNDGLQDQAILPSGMVAYPSWFLWLFKSSTINRRTNFRHPLDSLDFVNAVEKQWHPLFIATTSSSVNLCNHIINKAKTEHGKTTKQIKKIAVTYNIDFLNHYTARMLWKKKKVNFSITFRENSILLKS